MKDQPSALSVRTLTVRFDGTAKLGPVSFDLVRHRTTVLCGAAGSGKSVLLRALNRLLDMHGGATIEGSVLLNGSDVLAPGQDLAALRQRLGMVFHEPVPLPMSVRENFRFALRLRGHRRRAEIETAMIDALARVGLWPMMRDALGAPAAALPQAMQQLICIARALALNPDALLLDDPTRSLDPVATADFELLFDSLKSDVTLLLATRQIGQAARCADQLLLLEKGLVIEAGSPAAVLRESMAPRTRAFLRELAG